MFENTTDRQNGHDSHDSQTPTLSDRERRALSECMTVVPDVGVARGAPGMYRVVGENGSTYTVDTDEGACTCPDFEYNLSGDDQCKHLHRVAFATGERAIPASTDVRVDDLLGTAVDETPKRAATDGGAVVGGSSGSQSGGAGGPDSREITETDVETVKQTYTEAELERRTESPVTPIGVDGAGNEHYQATDLGPLGTSVAWAVDGDGNLVIDVALFEGVDSHDLSAWVDHVEQSEGWETCRYDERSLAEFVADALTGDESDENDE